MTHGLDSDTGVHVEQPRLLLGDWTWEPAASRPVEPIEEGPLGSIDLALRVLHDAPPPSAAYGVHRLSKGTAGVTVHLAEPLWKRLLALLQPPTELVLDSSGPVEWPAPLFPYQVDAVRMLVSRDAILLADDTGLGKTIETVSALRILAFQRRMQVALVVVPAGVLRQWRKELAVWAPELRVSTIQGPWSERAWQWQAPAHVKLVSYDTLREDAANKSDTRPRERTWDVVIPRRGAAHQEP